MIVNKYANGGGGSSSGVTPAQVQTLIDSSLVPYWESGETKDYVDGAVSGISLEGYATSGDMQSAFTLISETQQVAAAGLNQLEGRIDELSGNTPDISAYWTSAETKNYVDDKVVSAETQVAQSFANLDANVIQPMQGDIRELSGITEEIHDNFSAYTPTTGFSTINGSAITNGGNIVIQGGADMSAYYTSAQTEAAIAQAVSGLATEQYVQDALSGVNMDNYYTSAQTEEAITSKNYVTSAQVETQMVAKNYITSADTANFVTSTQVETQILEKNYVTSAQVETQIEAKNYVNSGDVKSQVETYNYATVSQIPTVPTSNTAFTNDAGYITDAAIENLVTSAQVETQIDTKAAAYTPTSGFSTINGSAITNGGNIVIEGGADMSGYWNSAETLDAISAATSGKADAANTTANTVNNMFPKWNEQGIITGSTAQAVGSFIKVNDTLAGVFFSNTTKYDSSAKALRLYSPLSAGTAGDILVSAGANQAPVWSAITFPDASNYVTSAQVETQIVEKNYVTSAQVETQITSKGYATVSQIPTVPTSNTAFTNDAGYVTSAQVETQILEKNYITSAATANMVTSTYVSTIWKGTQAEYDAITTKDPNTFYIIVNN